LLATIKRYFSISKWEGITFIVLLLFIFGLIGVHNYLPYLQSNNQQIAQADSVALQLLAQQLQVDSAEGNSGNRFNKAESDGTNIKAFAFDPNTIDSVGLRRLGLSERTAHTMLNYRNKGGKFYSKKDVEKMYSLSQAEYAKLEPFIQLPDASNGKKQFANNYTPREKTIVEINSADTAAWNKLYGIGSTLAQRIVTLREELGGFYSVNQLQEVYGLQDSVLQNLQAQLRIDASRIKKINLNSVLFQTLNTHPYFKNGLALALLKFRKANGGKINSLDQLTTIEGIDAKALEKAMHYLVL
jgi:competence protein ComEA